MDDLFALGISEEGSEGLDSELALEMEHGLSGSELGAGGLQGQEGDSPSVAGSVGKWTPSSDSRQGLVDTYQEHWLPRASYI